MDEKAYALSQGDQILDQLRQYDEKKHGNHMFRNKSSDSQLNLRFPTQIARIPLNRSRNASVSSRLSEKLRESTRAGEDEDNGEPSRIDTAKYEDNSTSTATACSTRALDMNEGDLNNELLNSQLNLLRLSRSGRARRGSKDGDGRNKLDLNELLPTQEYTSLKIEDIKPRYVPPINFAIVESELYRSGHPQPINFLFLKTLRLKTIIYLGDKEDNYDYYRWIKDNGISFKFFKMKEVGRAGYNHAADGEHAIAHSQTVMNSVLNLMLNRDNYPMLIHSNKGKHRVGVLVGLVRAYLQGWTLSGAFDEYGKFSHEKGDYDLEFVEMFQPKLKVDPSKKPEFVKVGDRTTACSSN
ncbi:hypothetical protein FOA43_001616 [Brettanomyces nanus]|uniref:Uncharacterized protein n=1 Tax=Eeniella nana TaxID=13502 RepID=A0A875RXS5_EENNA|nr:uncharacterized protein FOA43_001616 [Brettanomyces nanus]QPG74291.1 hypothetical protein FOA43_001616 [Brettanomyces nanus]